MGLISQRIEAISNGLTDVKYFRLSTTQKAEFELSRTALSGLTAIIYGDLPEIPITQNPLTITEEYPVKMWFLQLQPEPDDSDIDTLLDATKVLAFEFFKEFRKEPFFNIEDVEGITLNAVPTFQLGAEYFSGWELTFVMAIESCLDPQY